MLTIAEMRYIMFSIWTMIRRVSEFHHTERERLVQVLWLNRLQLPLSPCVKARRIFCVKEYRSDVRILYRVRHIIRVVPR